MKSQSLPGSRRGRRRGASPLSTPAEPIRTAQRRRPSPVWIGAAGLVLLSAGISAWYWQHRAASPAPPAGMGPPPAEARLLAAAARAPHSPGPYLELAEQDSAAGRAASALWAYAEAMARAPSDEAIRLKLAAAMSQLGQVQPAEAMLRAVAAGKAPAAAPARLDLAELLLSTGRPAAALAALRKSGPEAEALRGRAHEAAGDLAAAARSYRLAGSAGDPEGCERLARLELASGHLKSAREAMRSLAGLRSPRPADLLLVAAIHAAVGTPRELDTALARALRCVQLQPRSAEAHEQAGLLFLRKGDRAAALQQLRSAVQLDPHRVEARGRLADLLRAMGQTAGAHRERAAYYELKEQPDRALAEARRAGEAGLPDDLDRAEMMVRAATESQQLRVAIREARDGLTQHPGDTGLMLQLGLFYQRDVPRAELERLCRDWRAVQPASGLPDWLEGRRAVAENRLDDAIRLFQAAVAKEPRRSDFCMALGLCSMAIGTPENLARARPWLEKAVALNPHAPGPHQHLGRLLEQTRDPEGARREYLQCLDLQPDQAGVISNLSRVLARGKRPEVAALFANLARGEQEQTRERQQLTHRVRTRPNDPAPRLELAHFLIRRGQIAAAKNQLEPAAGAGPVAVPARRMLAEVDRLLRVQAPAGG